MRYNDEILLYIGWLCIQLVRLLQNRNVELWSCIQKTAFFANISLYYQVKLISMQFNYNILITFCLNRFTDWRTEQEIILTTSSLSSNSSYRVEYIYIYMGEKTRLLWSSRLHFQKYWTNYNIVKYYYDLKCN